MVTGTNGKTTTTGMLEAILQQTGRRVTACGNIGWPVIEAVTADPRQEAIAVELSSFQLHWAPSVRPAAGVVLNVAEDHLDWHGSMAAYAADKARALTRADRARGGRRSGRRGAAARRPRPESRGDHRGRTGAGWPGLRAGQFVDDAFGSGLGSGSGNGLRRRKHR